MSFERGAGAHLAARALKTRIPARELTVEVAVAVPPMVAVQLGAGGALLGCARSRRWWCGAT